jgi:hypothetical protein
MIDRRQTEGFERYCQMLERGQRGDRAVEKAILEHSKAANEHMAKVLGDVADLPEVFGDMAADFSADELTILRKRLPFTNELFEKFAKATMWLAATFFKELAHPAWPPLHELANTYPFRFALCAYLLFEQWVADGRPKLVRADKLRNDVVDVSFAAYGTFFDGLLTADKKLKVIYGGTVALMQVIAKEFSEPER